MANVSHSSTSGPAQAESSSRQLISNAIHTHLIQSGLIDSDCFDVRLRAFGRIYKAHRLILTQAGFFRAMICSGYSESTVRTRAPRPSRQRHSSSNSPFHHPSERDENDDILTLSFDDPQVTRAAFEYCLSYLYGASPQLVLPEWATVSPAHPLSVPFSITAAKLQGGVDVDMPKLTSLWCPPKERNLTSGNGYHPATPRFLASLIATSVYLSIPALVSTSLSLILCSITPYTVPHYLRLANGHGIEGAAEAREREMQRGSASGSDNVWDWELEGPVWGIDELGTLESWDSSLAAKFANEVSIESQEQEEGIGNDSDDERRGSTDRRGPRGSVSSLSTAGYNRPPIQDHRSRESLRPIYLYGVISDKIGEACACWFSRWGQDVFEVEELLELNATSEDAEMSCEAEQSAFRLSPYGQLPNADSIYTPPPFAVWSRKGMPAAWLNSIIASDSFFVASEWDRYTFATHVVELRRRQRMREERERSDRDSLADSSYEESADRSTKSFRRDVSSLKSYAGDSVKSSGNDSPMTSGTEPTTPTRGLTTTESVSSSQTATCTNLDDEDAEESQFASLFRSGIYYTHMSFEELSYMRSDLSPITHESYVAPDVLQHALWAGQTLRSAIHTASVAAQLAQEAESTSEQVERKPPASGGNRKAATVGELGLAKKLEDFACAQNPASTNPLTPSATRRQSLMLGSPNARNDSPNSSFRQLRAGMPAVTPSSSANAVTAPSLTKRYFPVPSDDTTRLGDGLSSLISSASTASAVDLHDCSWNASGVALIRDPSTLALPTTSAVRPRNSRRREEDEALSSSRAGGRGIIDAENFFGIENDVVQGKELAARAKRLRKLMDASTDTISSNETDLDFDAGPSSKKDRELDESGESEDESDMHERPHNTTREGGTPAPVSDPSSATATGSDDGAPPPSAPAPLLGSMRWTSLEPMRVGVEFWGVHVLPERVRLYSPTFFFAGSLWNVYVQTLRKPKGLQLGVYLHRQNPNDSLPPSSVLSQAVPPRSLAGRPATGNSAPVQDAGNHAVRLGSIPGSEEVTSQTPPYSLIAPLRPTGTGAGGTVAPAANMGSALVGLPASAHLNMPYRDERPSLQASFSIHCPSPLGTALTRFASAPDRFSLSQSWGWKSSSLLGTTWLEDGILGDVMCSSSGRFRCVCTIGLV